MESQKSNSESRENTNCFIKIDSTVFMGIIKDVEVSILNYSSFASSGICCLLPSSEECKSPSEPLNSIPISYALLSFFSK